MKREIFQEEHEIFRDVFRKFLEKHVVSHQEEWLKAGIVSREVWQQAGEQGFIAPWLPEEYGCMMEYPIARTFLDTRVTTIYAGSTEIMKEVIGRQLGM